jgi:pimeloyl-ACP methyl ester carboxylesterase
MKSMFMILLMTIATLCIIFGLLVIFNSGNPKPYTDNNGNVIKGSISEKLYLDINGYKQGLIIKSINTENPVLLYLHGGMPEYFLSQKYPTGLENYFTVVRWEQRGVGMSFDKNKATEKITTQQLIEDTKTLAQYLIKRFGKEKIYLMGHSGGTFIGIQAATQAPELFHAYIAVAQITNQFESEKQAYNYMLKEYERLEDKSMITSLKNAQINADTLPDSYLKIRDMAMHKIGVGTMRDMKSIVTGLFFPSLLFKEYTIGEKIKLWQSKANSGVSIVWHDMIKTDVLTKIPELKIPIYFFHGEHDYTVSYSLAKAYFDKIKAPKKQFFCFSESAHSPIFEEPEKCGQLIRENILK